MKYLFLAFSLLALRAEGQPDSSSVLMTGPGFTIFNSFAAEGFSTNTFMVDLRGGYLRRMKSHPHQMRGVTLKVAMTGNKALSRYYTGRVGDFGRYHDVTFSDKLGLKTINLGFIWLHQLTSKSFTALYLNPELLLGFMRQSLTREFVMDLPVGIKPGLDLSAGFTGSYNTSLGFRIDLGYRSLSINPTEPGLLQGPICWSGFHISAGFSIIL